MRVRIYIYKCVCVFVCMYVCMYEYMYVCINIHTHAHTHTHTHTHTQINTGLNELIPSIEKSVVVQACLPCLPMQTLSLSHTCIDPSVHAYMHPYNTHTRSERGRETDRHTPTHSLTHTHTQFLPPWRRDHISARTCALALLTRDANCTHDGGCAHVSTHSFTEREKATERHRHTGGPDCINDGVYGRVSTRACLQRTNSQTHAHRWC